MIRRLIFEEIFMLDAPSLDTLFRNARSQNGWLAEPVSDDQLRALYDILQWAPTTMNTQPMRVVFVRTPEEGAPSARAQPWQSR